MAWTSSYSILDFHLVSCNVCIQLKINRDMRKTERGKRLLWVTVSQHENWI